MVIEHGLNVKVGDGLEPTLGDLERLSRLPNLHVKLTFIPTGWARRTRAATCTTLLNSRDFSQSVPLGSTGASRQPSPPFAESVALFISPYELNGAFRPWHIRCFGGRLEERSDQ